MTLFLGFIYILVLICPLFKKDKDFFSPIILFVITMCFYSLPDIIKIFFIGESKYASELSFSLSHSPSFVIHRFLILQILFVVCYYIGYNHIVKNKRSFLSKPSKHLMDANNIGFNRLIAVSGLVVCAISTYMFIKQVGGYQSLLMAFSDRDALREDTSFFQQNIGIIFSFSAAFCVKYISQKKNRHHYILWAILLVTGFFTQTSGGGRSQFVVFILSILCYYNFWGKKVDLFDKRYWPVFGALALFIISFQLLRTEAIGDISLSYMLQNSESLFDSMAYTKTQILIQNYFDTHDLWWGKIYTFLIYIFVPRSLYPAKPHIDEGDYIYNMIFDESNILNSTTFYNSWPPFTAGITYANWSIIGLIVGGVILGAIHAYMYNKIRQHNYSLFILVLYVFVVLKFQLTIFYIANLIYLIIEIYLVYSIYSLLTPNNKKNEIITNNIRG